MNEATGDIFGAMTEAYAANPNDPADFLVGEEANLVGDGPIRNMYNPGALGDPNCWSTSIKNTEVHAAAGPLNHWFYLLSQGSNASPASPTCNGSTVTGLGIQTAGKIFYNGLLLKTSNWTHGAARKATLQAAVNLYGTTNCTNFNTVKAAWDAISVPAQSGEATCGGGGTPSTCSEVTATGSASSGYVDVPAVLVGLHGRGRHHQGLPDRAVRRRPRPLPAAPQQQRLVGGRRGQRERDLDRDDHLQRRGRHLPVGRLRLLRLGLVHAEVRRALTSADLTDTQPAARQGPRRIAGAPSSLSWVRTEGGNPLPHGVGKGFLSTTKCSLRSRRLP